MHVLFSYNFHAHDLADENFAALYEQRRRDASFAFAYEKDGAVYALRDHLGIVPLYYRHTPDGVRFAASLTDLVTAHDRLHPDGLVPYLKFGTARLVPLVEAIHIVPPGTVVRIDPVSQQRSTVYAYRLRPQPVARFASRAELVARFEEHFSRAIRRLIRHDPVGLYLSGGIDSALIGIYLRRAGVEVNAYTSAPWGKTSSETPHAGANARAIQVAHHVVDALETDAYPSLIDDLPGIYGTPHGTPTGLGVASLWQRSSLADEKQVFFGQNSDTIMGCMPAQYLAYFTQFLPGPLRRKAHPTLNRRTLIANYLSFARRFAGDTAPFHLPPFPDRTSAIQKLILAGMFMAHTPADGEVLSQPAIRRDILASDPYYDVDLVEFCLGIPFRHRVAFSRESRIGLAFEKHLLQQLALRYLPEHIVFRKKAFVVSFERDERSEAIARTLPDTMLGLPLENTNERFAARILHRWAETTGLALAPTGSPERAPDVRRIDLKST